MIVISDLGGTVTTGYPVIGLVKWVRHNQSKLRANFYLARRVLPLYLFSKLKLINPEAAGQKLMVTALSLIRDPSPGHLEQMARWSVEHELWPKRRQDVVDRLAGHIQDGAQVYIASGVFEPTVKAFADRISVGAIGTPLEIVEGRVRFAEAIVHGERKARKVLAHLGVDKVDVAYGDTQLDIPLLKLADRPVAVYPNEALKAAALERGWEILGDLAEK